MNENFRIKNTLRNSIYGVLTQTITVLIGFITRTFFVKYLSVEYLGVNGLFTNVLTVLSLAELGFGGAMVYSMYHPLATGNKYKLKSLMKFYSKIYKVIGLSVGLCGLILVPFLDCFISDKPQLDNLILIYLFFLLNSVSSYFFAYKRSILQADQKQYIISKNQLIFNVLKSIFQIIILVLYKSYILFLCIQLLATIFENLYISKVVSDLYPYLKDSNNSTLDLSEKKSIWSNVKALMIYKVGSIALDGTDNIIISALVSVGAVGYLSNYTLIIGSVSMILQQFTNALTGSIGNYVATEDLYKQEILFHRIVFIYFIVFGFSFVALLMLLNPFITVWLGEEYTLSMGIVFVISLNWYITGIMNPVWTFRSTKGLFVYGKYRPVVSAIINLILSIILALQFGLVGVLIGTTITRLSTNVWFDPYIIYKHGFKKSPKIYFMKQIKYFVSLLIPILILTFVFSFISVSNYFTFISQMGIVVLMMICSMMIFYRNADEFKYLIDSLVKILSKAKIN